MHLMYLAGAIALAGVAAAAAGCARPLAIPATGRRAFLGGAIGLPAAAVMFLTACATTNAATSFATVQLYVADAAATIDKLVPLVTALDPAAATALAKAQTDADAAAKAFAALSGPAGGQSSAQAVITALSDALTVVAAVPGVPPAYQAAIAAAQVLLVTVGGFFTVAPTPPASMALSHPGAARAAWGAAKASPMTPAQADDTVRAFLAS